MTGEEAIKTLRDWVQTFKRYGAWADVALFTDAAFVTFGWQRLRRGPVSERMFYRAHGNGPTLGAAVEAAWREAQNHPAHPGRRMRKRP